MRRQSELTNVLHIGIALFWFLATFLVGIGLSSNPAEAQPFAYVISYHTRTIYVYDVNPASADFNKLVDTVELNDIGWSEASIAITPDATRAYVVNDEPGTVSVIDTDPSSADFNKLVATIEADGRHFSIAITPDGTRAYLTTITRRAVSVIDTDPSSADFNKLVATVDLGRNVPWAIAITPDGTRAYVTD